MRRERSQSSKPVRRGMRVAALALAAAFPVGCAGNKPVEACLVIESYSDLHTYDDQPHALDLYVFPLAEPDQFLDADVETLIDMTDNPPWVLQRRKHIQVLPEETDRAWTGVFPPTTRYLGLVADYYRGPDDEPGDRKQVVPAKCSWFGDPKVRLLSQDMLVES